MNARRIGFLVSCLVLASAAACSSSDPASSSAASPGADGGAGSTSTTGDGGPDLGTTGGKTAPVEWELEGTSMTWNGITFLVPKDWTSATAADGVTLSAPASQGKCNIVIGAPITAAATEEGRFAQLLELVNASFAGHTIVDEYGNPPPFTQRFRGKTAAFDYLGDYLQVDGSAIFTRPYLAVFGDKAVPVAPIQFTAGGQNCLTAGTGEVNGLVVLHSLTLAGAPALADLTSSVLGNYFSGSGNVGVGLTLGANGHYIRAYVLNGATYSPTGDVLSTTATWSGDGTFTIGGRLISYFPKDKPEKASALYFRTRDDQNSSEPSGWRKHFCELGKASTAPFDPYEFCPAAD